MKWVGLSLAILTLGACGSLPRDQERTLERIAAMREVRVGWIASAEESPHSARLRELTERSAAAAGGRPSMTVAAAEQLLLKLEAGELDLVVGEFDTSSPWYHRVHLLPPMAERREGESRLETTAAAPNGENAWIMLLEREARALTVPS